MKKNYLIYLILFLCLINYGNAVAQSTFFSQFHQTPALTNPAMVAGDDIFAISFLNRQQNIGIGAFTTQTLSVKYPLIGKYSGKRWGGVGGMLLNDAAGQDKVVKTVGGAANFAYSRPLKNNMYIALGAQVGYFQRSLDQTKLTTGAQWTGSAFNPALPIGENFTSLSKGFLSIETGLFFHQEDTLRRQRFYVGISGRQLNQANTSFTLTESKLPIVLVGTAGVRAFQNDNISVFPNVRVIQQNNVNQFNVGSAFKYHFGQNTDENNFFTENTIALNAWYSVNNAVIGGVELNLKRFALGVSYDFNSTNPKNLGTSFGALEVMVAYRKDLGYKHKPKEKEIDSTEIKKKLLLKKKAVFSTDSTTQYAEKDEIQSTHQTTDAEFSLVNRGVLFPYKRTDLSPSAKIMLNKLVETMKTRPTINLEISGHACNTGTAAENQIISEKRVEAVYDYFLFNGISPERLLLKAHGDKKPITPNDTEAGKIRNRRVEFRVIKK